MLPRLSEPLAFVTMVAPSTFAIHICTGAVLMLQDAVSRDPLYGSVGIAGALPTTVMDACASSETW